MPPVPQALKVRHQYVGTYIRHPVLVGQDLPLGQSSADIEPIVVTCHILYELGRLIYSVLHAGFHDNNGMSTQQLALSNVPDFKEAPKENNIVVATQNQK